MNLINYLFIGPKTKDVYSDPKKDNNDSKEFYHYEFMKFKAGAMECKGKSKVPLFLKLLISSITWATIIFLLLNERGVPNAITNKIKVQYMIEQSIPLLVMPIMIGLGITFAIITEKEKKETQLIILGLSCFISIIYLVIGLLPLIFHIANNSDYYDLSIASYDHFSNVLLISLIMIINIITMIMHQNNKNILIPTIITCLGILILITLEIFIAKDIANSPHIPFIITTVSMLVFTIWTHKKGTNNNE